MTLTASAATPLLSFEFNEATADSVKDSVNDLTGIPPADPPTMEAGTPSGSASDRAIHFESGQRLMVDDPDTKMQLDPADPSFTLQAWVKFSGNPANRGVFFYNNGPGGAVSFSVNIDRTVFVTTLGVLDASSTLAVIPDDEAWHHIAVVHENGVELRYYVDGVLADTREYTGGVIFTRTETSFSLGAEANGGLQYVGSLDRLKVTSGVLTAEELDSKAVPGPVIDTDNDGMPDDYEIDKGFNPNDPADAALDFDGDGVSNLDEYKAGTDPIDTTKPTIVSVVGSPTLDTVLITFSEELDPATATVAANYTITPALAVTAATYNRRVVTLTTAAQTPGGTAYTVAVAGVRDTSKNEVPAGSQGQFFSYLLTQNGVLKFSFWGGIPNASPVSLLFEAVDAQGNLRYPASPDWTGAVFSFNSRDILPTDANDNYAAVMEGFLTPTESGDYRFFIYSDDASQLYVSANATPPDITSGAPTAEEPSCCNFFTEPDGVHTRTSEPIPMVAGQRYYISLVYKEGGGGDYGQVAWRKEGDTTPAGSLTPIPGKYLSAPAALPAPAEGAFVTQTPAPNAKNVIPDTRVTIAHRDGKTEWTAANVSLKFDGIAVTPTFVKDGNLATITYQPPALLASLSTHTVTLGYLDPAGQPATLEWSFETAPYAGPILDKVSAYPAILLGAAKQTADQGGRTGTAGDYGLDVGVANGVGYVGNASFLNAATADDTLSVAVFSKLRSVRAASGFWLNSLSSNNGTRGFQAHLPWSDSTIYFDTSGCCGADTQRINANIDTFADYSGDATWWQQWHHFVFVKDGTAKRIYINGKLFLEGLGDPLKTDFTTLIMGGGPSITENRLDGILDDFAVYNGALTEAQALSLSGGAAPGTVAGLVAHWDFNTQPTVAPQISISGTGVITYTGTLESSATVNGGYAPVGGAASPYTAPKTGAAMFYRAKQ